MTFKYKVENADTFSKCFQCHIVELMPWVIDVFVNGVINHIEAETVILIGWITWTFKNYEREERIQHLYCLKCFERICVSGDGSWKTLLKCDE